MKLFGILFAFLAIAFAVVSGMSTIPKMAGQNGPGPGGPPGGPPPDGPPPGPPPSNNSTR